MSHQRHALALGALLALSPAGRTQAQPVNATNLTPFTGVLGQPAIRSAALPGRGRLDWRADIALASHSAIGARGEEVAFIDGQTLRLAASLSYQPATRWQFSLEMPWISHSGGFLDATIEEWHNLTGLTNGERDRQDRDRLRFAYTGSAGSFELSDSRAGLGDIRASAVYALRQDARRQVALRALVEVPTGDPARLTGNGATDIAVDLLVSGRSEWRNRPFDWFSQVGVLFPGDGELLSGLRRDAVPFAGLSLDWQWRPRIGLFAQTSLLAAPWRSELSELGGFVVELTTGLSWAGRQGQWYIGFSEDLRIDRSPDFVLRLGWRTQERPP